MDPNQSLKIQCTWRHDCTSKKKTKKGSRRSTRSLFRAGCITRITSSLTDSSNNKQNVDWRPPLITSRSKQQQQHFNFPIMNIQPGRRETTQLCAEILKNHSDCHIISNFYQPRKSSEGVLKFQKAHRGISEAAGRCWEITICLFLWWQLSPLFVSARALPPASLIMQLGKLSLTTAGFISE